MWQDLRYAVRMLIKTPGFASVAFLAIALGIGVNTTIFGIVNTLLLRSLATGHSDRLVRMFTVDPRFPGVQPSSYLNFLDCAQQNTSLTGLAAYAFSAMGMTRNSETQNVLGLVVTGNYFDLLEVKPVLGRTFLSGEDTTPNGHPVAVLGYKFWQKLGGNAEIVGSTITLNRSEERRVG